MEKSGFIFVNLLPYRQKIKALKIKNFALLMSCFGIVGLFLIVIAHMLYSIQIDNQEDRNKFILAENVKLDENISSIITLKEEIKSTLEKRKIVENLQVNRADGVNIINELANNLPDGASLKSFKKVGNKITIIGQTTANNKVSNYMTALGDSPIFQNPALIEVKSIILVPSKTNGNKKEEEIKISEFSITVEMKKSETEKEEDKLKNKKVKSSGEGK